MIAMVVGCGKDSSGNAQSAGSAPEKVKISFWYTASEGDPNDMLYKFLQETENMFVEENPHVEIETFILGGDGALNYKTKLATEAAADNLPDVFMTWHGAPTQPMVDAGLLMPFDDIINNDPDLSRTMDYSKLSLCTYNDTLYGIPDSVDVIGFFYNKSLLDEYGIEVPQTYEELLVACDTFMETEIIPMALGLSPTNWMSYLIWMYFFMQEQGYDRYVQDFVNGEYDFTDPAYIKAMEEAQSLALKGYHGKDFNSIAFVEARTMFVNGETAFLLGGTWDLARMYEDLGDDMAFMTFPSINGQDPAYMLAASRGYALSKDAPQEAVDFITFLYSPERQARYAELGTFVVPKNLDIDESKLPPIMSDITDQLDNSKLTFITWGDFIDLSVVTDLKPAGQAILAGEDPLEVLSRIQEIKELNF